ncbi:hypothetical protein Tco_0914008 [Tanacetum coccineum]
MKLNEIMELRDGAYENTRIYKERTKKWHDSRLRGDKDFKVGDKVLLFNSRFKMHPGKLKSKWYGPNVVKTVYPYGTMEITDKNRISFKVNGQRLKKYYDGHIDTDDKEDLAGKEINKFGEVSIIWKPVPHKGVKASSNSDVMNFFTSAQDGDPSQDDVRLCLGDDLKKAQDQCQRQA